MKHCWYEYFSKREYAEAFLDGDVLFRTLSYFRDREDRESRQIIGDEHEGTRSFMPSGGLIVTNHSTRQHLKFVEPWAFESVVKAGEIFVFCVSTAYKESLVSEFGAVACVEISNQSKFFDRLRPVLPSQAKLIWGKVIYYERGAEPKAEWAIPERIAKSKLQQFSCQGEYRFASVTDALNFGKTRQRLIGRAVRPKGDPTEHHWHMLRFGSLRDICTLHINVNLRSPLIMRCMMQNVKRSPRGQVVFKLGCWYPTDVNISCR